MNKLYGLILAALLAGCSTYDYDETGGAEDSGKAVDGSASGNLDGVYGSGSGGYDAARSGDFYNDPSYGQQVVGGPTAKAKDRVIYFTFDSANIDQRAEAIVKAHADYLVKHPNTTITLEGHTDERGSREYNIALGERRAVSVLRKFVAYGVPANRVRIVSYGEEYPAVTGYNEDAYNRNRRAVIQY